MIIRGVFSLSIINRLKSLLTGETDNEEKDIRNDVSNTSDDVQVTSSQIVNDDVVSGTKTTVPREVVKEEPEADKKDLTFKSDIETLEEPAEPEIVEEVEEVIDEVEETAEVIDETSEEEEAVEETSEDNVEEVKEDLNKKETKRDTMTLLTDKELLTDSNRDPDFTDRKSVV